MEIDRESNQTGPPRSRIRTSGRRKPEDGGWKEGRKLVAGGGRENRKAEDRKTGRASEVRTSLLMASKYRIGSPGARGSPGTLRVESSDDRQAGLQAKSTLPARYVTVFFPTLSTSSFAPPPPKSRLSIDGFAPSRHFSIRPVGSSNAAVHGKGASKRARDTAASPVGSAASAPSGTRGVRRARAGAASASPRRRRSPSDATPA